MTFATSKVYVVQRLTWQYNDNWHELVDDEPVKAFASREMADEYRKELERQHWPPENPAKFCGGFARASTHSLEEIHIRLREMRLPLLGDYCYHAEDERWWSRCLELAGDDRMEELLSIFNRLRQYEVVEVELSF